MLRHMTYKRCGKGHWDGLCVDVSFCTLTLVLFLLHTNIPSIFPLTVGKLQKTRNQTNMSPTITCPRHNWVGKG